MLKGMSDLFVGRSKISKNFYIGDCLFFGDKRLLKVMNFCFQPYSLEIFFPWSLDWSPLIALNLLMGTDLNGIDWSCFSKEVESKIENLRTYLYAALVSIIFWQQLRHLKNCWVKIKLLQYLIKFSIIDNRNVWSCK